MTHDNLQNIIMDAALGEAGESVAVLLEALAERDADVRKQVQAWKSIVDLARRAGQRDAAPLPAFPRNRLETSRRARGARKTMLWITAAAACVMIGFAIGYRPPAAAPPASVAVIPTTLNNPIPNNPVASVADFWSADHFRAAEQKRNVQSTPEKLTWKDLIKLGGKS